MNIWITFEGDKWNIIYVHYCEQYIKNCYLQLHFNNQFSEEHFKWAPNVIFT